MTIEQPCRVRPMHPMSAQTEGRQPGGADGGEEHDIEGELEDIRCGQYEKPPVRVARNPQDPTDKEVDEHNVTHLPHRSWCPVCVKARGKEEPHRKVRDRGGKPIVSMDYKSFGEAPTEEDKVTMIVVKDETTGCVAAHVCEQKGAMDKWAVERVCDDIDMFGHTEVLLKGDGEPALVQVQTAIKDKRAHPTICQNPPAYNPQANGAAERAVQEVMAQVRAMKIGLDQRLGITVKTDWKVLEWIVELSTVLINRCLVGRDGKTPYARLMAKDSSKELVEFGERVLAKIARGSHSSRRQALKTRWEDAIWVGIAKRSNEHIVVLEGGGPAIRCRTIKRRPLSSRWSAERIAEIEASPRKPCPEDPTRHTVETERRARVREADAAENLGKPETQETAEPLRREFKITRRLLEKHGYSSSCPGCDAMLNMQGQRPHSTACRKRVEEEMRADPDDLQRLQERDSRLHQEEKP